jgi:hypothetical protein
LGSTPDGSAVAYFANVVGKDNWICAAAGPGQQDTWTRMYCLNVANPGASKYIDIVNRTVNGAYQSDPNWPNSGIGIHGMMGGTGDHHVELTFHGQNWGGNGDAVFNLNSNTWQLVKGQQVSGGDIYWGGHFSLGQGILANGAGNVSGNDSRGVVLRNADATMDSTQYHFIGQPSSPYNGWCDAEHTSWSNSLNNANAPVFQSRYISGCNYTWSSEIIALATDNSNTVYRFAHNYNGCPGSYYSQAFAQVSNDGMFVLFSSWWGGNLGGGSGFDCSSGRIDTFILKLVSGDAPPPPPTPPVLSISTQPTNMISGMTVMPDLTGTLLPAAAHTIVALADNTNCQLGATTTTTANGTTGAWSLAGLTVTVTSPPQNCTIRVRDTSNGLVTDVVSNGFNVTVAAPETVTVSAEPSGMCQVQGTLTQTVVNQIFAFPNMTVTATVPPQNCQLRLHDSNPGVPDILSNVFTVLETAPTVPVLAFTQQPSTTIDGLTMTPAIAGTLTPGSIRSVTMTVNPSNCTLTGNLTINTLLNGNWSFPGLVAHAVGFPATCSVTIRDTSTTGAAATIVSMNFTINEVPTPPPPVTANRIILPRGIGK